MRFSQQSWLVGFLVASLSAGLPASSAWAGAGLTGSGVTTTTPPPPAASSAPTILPASMRPAVSLPSGSVLCGIDDIFFNGFETAAFMTVLQLPGGIASPGQVTDITGTGTLSVTIVSPASGATIGDSSVNVSGTFVGPVNTGIAINGVAGYTVNGAFFVPDVPLASGSNTLTATATTLPGATATYNVTVTESGVMSAVSMSADHPTQYAPATVVFTYDIETLPSGFPVQTVAINFKGSGTDDFSGTSLSGAPTQYAYSAAGVYLAYLKVTDTHGNVYTATRPVAIQDLSVQRGMVCDIYGYLQAQLAASSATNASLAFQPIVQSQYQSLFSAMGSSNLPTVASGLGVVMSGALGQGFAELLLERDDTTAQTRTGFPLRMTQGADGVWRISEM